MGRREQFTVGELTLAGISTELATDTFTVLVRNAAGDAILVSGAAVPTAGLSGFALGCIFINLTAKTIYTNTGAGTATSCAFALLGAAVGGGAITATELASNAVTTAKILANQVTPIKMSIKTKTVENTDGNITVLAAALLQGYLEKTNCSASGKTLTFDTASNIQAVSGFAATTGAWFDWDFVNSSGQTITLTTASGLSLKGTAAITNGKTARVRFINTGAGTMDVVIVAGA